MQMQAKKRVETRQTCLWIDFVADFSMTKVGQLQAYFRFLTNRCRSHLKKHVSMLTLQGTGQSSTPHSLLKVSQRLLQTVWTLDVSLKTRLTWLMTSVPWGHREDQARRPCKWCPGSTTQGTSTTWWRGLKQRKSIMDPQLETLSSLKTKLRPAKSTWNIQTNCHLNSSYSRKRPKWIAHNGAISDPRCQIKAVLLRRRRLSTQTSISRIRTNKPLSFTKRHMFRIRATPGLTRTQSMRWALRSAMARVSNHLPCLMS